ncbi:MAG: hypothetical protein A2144_03825 [Chloroflexi bacterium RBG_16_50_9]|nr:MAG: hypothetical protein A2144_03825 [Chloroflexi bacterium RBG_16_50_9]
MGIIIGLSGVDGSGKTTAAIAVMKKIQASGQEVTYHHELDFILLRPMFRLFTRLMGKKAANNARENLITGAEKGRPVVSDIYYLLIWLDNLLAYAYFKLKRGTIIHDRWLYDFTTFFDHKFYRNRLIRRLFISFPRPDVYILLTVPEEIAFQRKKGEIGHLHHDVKYYRDMAALALENARRCGCDGIIDASRPVEKVTDDVLALLPKLD